MKFNSSSANRGGFKTNNRSNFGNKNNNGFIKNGGQPGGALRKPEWEKFDLLPFEKNFYVPHPSVVRRYVFILLLNISSYLACPYGFI